MKINEIECDICGIKASYPKGLSLHQHKELEIGGVPLNIWSYHTDKQESFELSSNKEGIFIFKSHLPHFERPISLQEGNTPIIQIQEYEHIVFLKHEGYNPTGSFKDRGIVVMVNDTLKQGKKKIAIPSTGNAAMSLSTYCKYAGLESLVFIPSSTSMSKKRSIESVIVEDANIIESYEHFFRFINSNPDFYNGYPTNNIPFSIGLKTLAYELYQTLGRAPDWLLIPCGSGGNLVSQYQGFKDLLSMKLIDRMPRFVPIQLKGGDPITHGFINEIYDSPVVLRNILDSSAEQINSDTNFNYFKIMRILLETNGVPVSVTDEEIRKSQIHTILQLEYSSRCVFAAYEKIKNQIEENEVVVMVGTARDRS